MLHIDSYDVYIFDCDGVILDSNVLKIDAMRNTLIECKCVIDEVNLCVDYFMRNFGKSRFHHVDQFIECYLTIDEAEKAHYRENILNQFSLQCKKLYLTAELTPKFLEFISLLKGDKYVASGSEQQELRDVFQERGLSNYFCNVYGSPIRKTELVKSIMSNYSSGKAVMIGDAVSDFDASQGNNIDFVCYLPYSNVKDEMMKLSKKHGFHLYKQWPQIN